MSRTFPRSIWILLLAVLALVGAGCGGDDGGGGSVSASGTAEEGSEPLDEEEFLEQFDQSCTDTQDELNEIEPPTDLEELAERLPEAIEIATEGLGELEEITPPEELQEDVDELLGVLQQRIDLQEEIQAAAEDGDDDEVSELDDQNADLEEEVDEVAEDIGLECFVDDPDTSDDFSDDTGDLSSDFSDDLSSDFSDDFSDDPGTAVDPSTAIPEYGSVGALDDAADACFGGDFDTCDRLYFESDPGTGYRDYGDSCGGRQEVGTGVLCVDAFG